MGHTNAVNCICVLDIYLASGSTDKTIKIWDIRNGTCIDTLVGHTGQVNAIISFSEAKERLICSGSNDKSIIIWNVDQCKY